MAKKFLKRFISKHEGIKSHPSLKIFGDTLHHPNLWHISRHAVIKAVTIGCFVSFMPLPGHMLTAALLSVLVHANLIIAVALVWISNPFTMGPMYYLGYKVGIWVLRKPEHPFIFDLSVHWFVTEFEYIAGPLFLGCIICGIVLALLGNLCVRLLWRCSVSISLRNRKTSSHENPHTA